MRLLADENIERAIVIWLRERGHDVSYVIEMDPAAPDPAVGERANRENRVLISYDLDFGRLVFKEGMRLPGLVLMRDRTPDAADVLNVFVRRWLPVEHGLSGKVIILEEDGPRIRPMPR